MPFWCSGTRLIIRWRRLRRDEAAQNAELKRAAATAFSVDERVAASAGTLLTDAPISETPLADATPVPAAYPEPPPIPVEVAAPVPEFAGAQSSIVYAAGDGPSWTPPQPAGWTPEVASVSWAEQSLFHTRETSFEEPTHIPKVLPGDIPTNEDDYVLGPVTPTLAALMPLTDRTRVENELSQGGFYQPHALQNLSAVRFFGILLSLMFFGILFMFVPPVLEIPVAITALVVSMLFWAVPRVLIQNRGTDRKSEIERAMLDMCVSQGLTIRASMHRISGDLKPVYPVLASELAIVSRQTEVGNLRVALNNFADRVSVAEVDSFVSLMNQSEQMGTSISDALTEYSNTMRESLRQRTDEKANKASFNLMFPTVLFMMPAVFMFLMGPAILELQDFFDDGGGTNLQQGADAVQSVGNANQQ